MAIRKDLNGLFLFNSAGTGFLVEGGQRRGFLSGADANRLLLPTAKPVTPSDYPNLIEGIDENAPWMAGVELIANPAGTVCVLEGNVKRYVSHIAFCQYQFNPGKVKSVSQSKFDDYDTGPAIEERHDAHKLWERVPFRPGNVLISPNGRFRLYFENNGSLALWGYNVASGKQRLWGPVDVNGKPGVRFNVPKHGDAVLVAADGTTRVILNDHFAVPQNVCFVVEDNGNSSFWGVQNGHMVLHGYLQPLIPGVKANYVEPNTGTVEIPATTGTIGVTANPDGYVYNTLKKPIGVRNGDRYETVLPDKKIGIAQIGVVELQIVTYKFASTHDDGSPPTANPPSADATPKVPGKRGPGGEPFTYNVMTESNGRLGLRLSQPMESAESVSSEGIDMAQLRRDRTGLPRC